MDEEPQKQSAQDEQIERSAWKMSFIIYPHIMYIIYYIYIMYICKIQPFSASHRENDVSDTGNGNRVAILNSPALGRSGAVRRVVAVEKTGHPKMGEYPKMDGLYNGKSHEN